MLFKKIQLSTLAITVIVIACFIIDFDFKNWEKRDRVIEWDVHWYYSYLPATFIYHDIKLEKSEYVLEGNLNMFWSGTTADGKKYIKPTMGMSILYAPFFFVAHSFASMTGYLADGFSEPYKIFLLLSAVFYLVIGLDFLRKILQHYNFTDAHIAITLLLVGLGTNLLCYSSQSAPMPHVYIFCLFSVFIYYTIKWYQFPSTKHSIIIGLLLGLITLTRPSNILVLVFFSLYGVSNFSELKQRLLTFKKDTFYINVILFFALLVWIPQFLYWKTVTGNYFFYSYTDEGFFFNDPKILEGLFGFRKGWLVYTPLMAFSLIGIFFMKNAVKKLQLPIVLFFLLNIYIIFSWWCWWYGGTYGQRSMIDCYPILAIPFASFIQQVFKTKLFYRYLFICLAVFFIWLNIFQTYQFENQSLHYDGMTKKLYFRQFGKLDKIPDFDKYVSSPDYEKAKLGKRSFSSEIKFLGGKKIKEQLTITLKAANDKYVCADEGLNNIVVANKERASTWETFTLIVLDKNECAIQSYKNLFVSSDLGHQNEITAIKTKVDSWETFSIINLDDDLVAFKAANGKYLSVDNPTLRLYANADSIGTTEKFRLTEKNK